MSTETENQNENKNYYSNAGYNTANILAIRLDTKPILDQIEAYLKGEMVYETVENGLPVMARVKIGEQKCNQEGIQGIMGYAQSVINSAAVQGNVKQEIWLVKNKRHRWQFTKMVVTNCETWNIRDADIEPICDTVINLIYYFTSRLIDNKERESYASYTQSQVTQVRETGSNGFLGGLFGGKSK